MSLSDQQLLRYSRQIFLSNIDVDGQQRLLNAHVCILGVGGLGSLTAPYLAAAGVGKITLVDDDEVDISNLHRQLIYAERDVGKAKVEIAQKKLTAINQECCIETIDKRLNSSELQSVIQNVDIVLDGTDNFESRFVANAACFELSKPLLSAAVNQYFGQISFFDFSEGSPCYSCLYPDVGSDNNNCSENGVLGPVAGIIASWQALHALKYLLGIEVESLHRLMLIDMLSGLNRNIVIQKDKNCDVCNS